MRYLISLLLTFVLGYALLPNLTEAAKQSVVLTISGRYCKFHIFEVTESLKRVSGVLGVDLDSVHGYVVVVMNPGKVNPDHILSAVRQIKGDGYYCKGEFQR